MSQSPKITSLNFFSIIPNSVKPKHIQFTIKFSCIGIGTNKMFHIFGDKLNCGVVSFSVA